MRACSFVCLVICCLIIIDQFYRGFDAAKLFMGGFVAVAFITDNSRMLRKLCRKLWIGNRTQNNKTMKR